MELKKICLRSVAVICAVFILPLSIWGYGFASEHLNKIAAVCADLTMGQFENLKNENKSSATYSQNDSIAAKSAYKSSLWDIDMAQEEIEIPSESSEIPSPLPSDEVLNAIPYPENIDDNDGVIENYTYGYYQGEQYFDLDNGGQVRNCTSLTNTELYEESQKSIEFQLDKNSDEPQILIYHTHATESFEPYARDYYDLDFTCKSTDRTMNIVSVGDRICQQLDEAGIAYIHDTMVHDYPSYNGSYESSRETVLQILEEYPSIKICLDIHRDGIEREDGTRLAPVTQIDGKEAAQIMIISGCDDGTMNMPNYLQNFRFASLLQSQIESDWEGLTRPVLFDYRFYNQDLTRGSLLIEVGSHGNSIEQVQYTGELIGKSLVKLFEQ